MYDKVGIVSLIIKSTKVQNDLSAWKLPLFKDDIILSFSILKKYLEIPQDIQKENYQMM